MPSAGLRYAISALDGHGIQGYAYSSVEPLAPLALQLRLGATTLAEFSTGHYRAELPDTPLAGFRLDWGSLGPDAEQPLRAALAGGGTAVPVLVHRDTPLTHMEQGWPGLAPMLERMVACRPDQIAAMKPAGPVLVLGMHRSGTSATMEALQHLGVFLGDPSLLLEANRWNPRGHFEHRNIVDVNDALLASQGCGWDLPPTPQQAAGLAQPPAELSTRMRRQCANLAANARRQGYGHWGFKDPRLLLLWPAWEQQLPASRRIGCLRHPLHVAQSLWQRNGHSLQLGLWLCQQHLGALRHIVAADPQGTLLLCYDQLLAEPMACLRRISERLNLGAGAAALADAANTVSAELHHHADTELQWPPGFDSLRADYEWLLQRSEPRSAGQD